jgi:1,4-alpha-glucan branching enzyme
MTASPPTSVTVSAAELDMLVNGAHANPHGVLGAHPTNAGTTVVRTLRPEADSVAVVVGRVRTPLQRIHDGGVFAGELKGAPTDYRLEVTYFGSTHTVDDPYRWLPTLGEMDLHLIGEGRHEQLWDVLGAHERTYDTPGGPVSGVSFAVWAPNAKGIRVAGDFDYWSGRALPMRSLGNSGVWELFVPDVHSGLKYKFQVLGADGKWRLKADPMAFATEVPPATASVVFTSHYQWQDADWLEQRSSTEWHAAPISIYEVHLGSWRQGLSYQQLAEELVAYVKDTGFTHVEFLPVAEHPFGGSWGYHLTAYYAPTARFGTPDDLRFLIDSLHQAGIGVLVDWVPGHFATDEWALVRFDGTALYEHPDPRRGWHPEWGSYIFNHGRAEVRNFLVANALYWLEEFHIDGLRVDGVASMLYLDYSRKAGEWVPNQYGGRENLDAVSFMQEVNATAYRRVPGAIIIAEESTAWPGVTRATYLGGLGFGFKWNMGWMNDTLSYLGREPIFRQYHHSEMTFAMVYAFSENYVLPLSHDEVVHGKGSIVGKVPGDRWQQMATVRALYAYMWAHPGKQLLFMGSEFAQYREWSESRSLDWPSLDVEDHRGVQAVVRDLNRTYAGTRALYSQDTSPTGFAWIDANDRHGNVFSFLRYGDDGSAIACVSNFSAMPHENYRIGLPKPGRWAEVINTDADTYGGSGVGNLGGVDAVPESWHGQPASTTLRVPPLGTIWLRYDGAGAGGDAEAGEESAKGTAPSSAIPSSAIPSSAIPSSAIPSSAIPSSAIPSSDTSPAGDATDTEPAGASSSGEAAPAGEAPSGGTSTGGTSAAGGTRG